jgi:superoxide dismutase, Fe-Mn family
MTLHHDKHHKAYVTNLNTALANYTVALTQSDVPGQIALQSAIKFNGGGHINHSLFWKTLAPADSRDASDPDRQAPTLLEEIKVVFGGMAAMTSAFSAVLMGIQGSGWGWLVKKGGPGGGLDIVTTPNQDPVSGGDVPIIGIDMWEHAYYLQVSLHILRDPRQQLCSCTLQYQNGKQSYVDNVWKVINWTAAEERFTGTRDEAFGILKNYMA